MSIEQQSATTPWRPYASSDDAFDVVPPTDPWTATWDAYDELGFDDKRAFRMLVGASSPSTEDATPVEGASKTTGSLGFLDVFGGQSGLSSMVESLLDRWRKGSWDLEASAIPAYVPQEWLDELDSYQAEDGATFDLDWDA